MKTLSRKRFESIERWICTHGRALEASYFGVLFRSEPVDAFLDQLAQYQNPDGGFGHALEPDLWNPLSTPYVTQVALGLMASLGFRDASHPLIKGALAYLRSGDGFANGQWLFSVPSNNDCAHAPWWTYSPESNGMENIGLSAELAAHILGLCQPDDPLYQTAKRIALATLNSFMDGQRGGEMGLSGCAALMPHWAQMDIPYTMEDIGRTLIKRGSAAIVRDPAQWHSYVPRPSSAISSPASPLYPGNEDAIHLELDWLIDALPEDDVWPINWSWGANAQRYPRENALMQEWWKARAAADKLVLLRNFDRLA